MGLAWICYNSCTTNDGCVSIRLALIIMVSIIVLATIVYGINLWRKLRK